MDLMGTGFGAIAGLFGLLFLLVGLIIVATLVYIVVSIVKRSKVAKDAGYDPMTMDVQMATQAMNSELLRPAAPAATMEQRLAEVDDLFSRGIISASEHASARTAILHG